MVLGSSPVGVNLNYEELGKHAGRITIIKPFINKHKREGINFSSVKDDWKKIGKNNEAIALNVLYAKKREKYTLLLFQNITQMVKNSLLF